MKVTYNQRTAIIALFFAPIAFYISLFLLSNYTLGDQRHYHSFYDALLGADISDIMRLGRAYVNSSEPVSILILWTGANLGIEKNIYISALNVILLLGILLLSRRYRLGWLMLLLFLTNFYVVVLLTGAERLKIALMFLVFATIFNTNIKYIFSAAATLAHFQTVILLVGFALGKSEKQIRRLFFKFKITKSTFSLNISLMLLISIIIFLFGEKIFAKIAYYNLQSITEFLNLLLLLVVALVATKNKFRMALIVIAMMIFVAFLGSLRVNMIGVVLVFYFLLTEGRAKHPVVYLMMIYFSLKTIPFVNNIIIFGNGFGNLG